MVLTQAEDEARVADIRAALRAGRVPTAVRTRLEAARAGRTPWVATMTPAELLVVRSHGLRPIAAIAATCWVHYGWSWSKGHAQGWHAALTRLKREAKAAGANVVLDVKMRTVPLDITNSMDFTLFGTAAMVDGLPPSDDPVVATVPALEFVKLLEASIVPTGLAVGAHYEWLSDWLGRADKTFSGNVEASVLTQFWERIRRSACAELLRNAASQGNGVLAHVNFGQMFKIEEQNQSPRFLGRQIVVGTTVDTPTPGTSAGMPWEPRTTTAAVPHTINMVVDMLGRTPLSNQKRYHQSYANEKDGAI